MTPEQYRDMVKKKSKYRNHHVFADGHKFDSKREFRYYQYLCQRLRMKEIYDFELQPKFLLLDTLRKNGETFRKVSYYADFKVYHFDGSVEVIDVKSPATRKNSTYRLKKTLFEHNYPHLSIKEV